MIMINLIYWGLVISATVYLLLLLVLTTGWYRLKTTSKPRVTTSIKISIVVAVRNEERNIARLLESIYRQDYQSDKIEIVLVDDHSTDKTIEEIEKFVQERKLEIRLIPAKGEGKKNALNEGFSAAGGELILTTDGDCELPPEWVKSFVSIYNIEKPALIFGPVVYMGEKTIMQKLFSLDFISLVASGAGSGGNRLPFMGNGANLAFSANAYRQVAGQQTGEKFASGDDVFLMHKMLEKFGTRKIVFLKNAAAIVSTKPPKSLAEFLEQRIRWASKAKAYKNRWAIFVSLAVLFFNSMLFVVLLGAWYINWFFAIYLLFILLKFLLDFPLLYEFSGFAGKRNLLPWLFPFEVVYPIYIVYAAFRALFWRIHWKGRKKLK